MKVISYSEQFNPAYVGEARADPDDAKPLRLDLRKLIQRRAVFERMKWKRPIVNLAVGIPSQYPSFGARVAGIGGFVNITQTAKEVVFMGSFTAKGLEIVTGIDLGREVLAQLAAPVPVAQDLKQMDARIFRERSMRLLA